MSSPRNPAPAFKRHPSSVQADLFFWAEEVSGLPGGTGPAYHVVSQVTGFPGTEAHDDWFGNGAVADEVAQRLAAGQPA